MSRRSIPLLFVGAIAVAATLVLGPAATAGSEAASAGTVVFIHDQEPPNLNQNFVGNGLYATSLVTNNIFIGGQIRDNKSNWVLRNFKSAPKLVKKSPLTVSVEYKPDARWSDGRPVTGADLRATWRIYTDPKNNVISRTGWEDIRSVTFKGKKATVVFRRPFAAWESLISGSTWPAHIVKGLNMNTAFQNSIPVSNGPWMFQSWQKGVQLSVRKNPRYTAGPAMKLDRVVFRYILDTNARFQALKSNEGQVMEPQPQLQIAEFMTDSKFKVDRAIGYSYEHVDIQLGPNGHPALKLPYVRQALVTGMNRTQIAGTLYKEIAPGLPQLDSLIFKPFESGYKKNFGTYKFSQQKVVQILRGKGCTGGPTAPSASNNDIFSCPGVGKLSFRFFTTTGNQLRALTFEIVQRQLKSVGIELVPRFQVGGTLFGTTLPSGDWDLIMFTYVQEPDTKILSRDLYACGGDQNYGAYCNRKLTTLLNRVAVTLDAKQRDSLLNQAESKYIAKDIPSIPLYARPIYVIRSNKVKGPVVHSRVPSIRRTRRGNPWVPPPTPSFLRGGTHGSPASPLPRHGLSVRSVTPPGRQSRPPARTRGRDAGLPDCCARSRWPHRAVLILYNFGRMFASTASFIAGRRAKFVVLGAWVALVAALVPLGSRFEAAQRNEPSSFLPESAESVAVLEASDGFPSGDVTPATVVLRDAGGLERGVVDGISERIEAAGIDGVGPLAPPTLSEDGTAAILTVPIAAEGEEDILIGAVEEVRGILAEAPAGVEALVTGPAGFSADASAVFEGINSTLLYATAALVFVLLVLIYRSPVFWILPLVSVLVAEAVVRGLGTLMADAGVVINGQTGGILLVLVFGAGTDYALLLTARYREELRRVEDRHEAMRIALMRAGPSIVASAATVVAALLCLTLADVSSISGLGPVGAMGVAVAAVAMLTLLPALLLVGGRKAFWPFVPAYGTEDTSRRGFWSRLGERIDRRPRPVWIGTALALGLLALGALTLDDDLTSANAFRGSVESVQGQRLVAEAFPAGASAPTVVLVTDRSRTDAVLDAARGSRGVAAVGAPETGEPGDRFTVILREDPYSEPAYAAVERLRDDLRPAGGDAVLVGGPTAEEADLRTATASDTRLLVPLVLLVVFAILVLLLRSLVAPVMLMATVVLSYFAALGGSLLLFEAFADFPGEDPSYPLIAFIFLVALGVDYNIFLMARAREEALVVPTRPAMRTALAVTGGVITSAGVVLAGTFAVLAVLPLVPLTQIGITVAFGVLLDTLVVRSVLVPALTFELGERSWWPSRLAHRPRRSEPVASGRPAES